MKREIVGHLVHPEGTWGAGLAEKRRGLECSRSLLGDARERQREKKKERERETKENENENEHE